MPRSHPIITAYDSVYFGDMTKRIQVQVRTIVPEQTNDQYDLSFTELRTVWAAHEGVKGEMVFDSHDIEQEITDKFYIRYMPNVTFENWVLWDSQRYRIINTRDLNRRKRWIVLNCNLKGPDQYNVNKA